MRKGNSIYNFDDNEVGDGVAPYLVADDEESAARLRLTAGCPVYVRKPIPKQEKQGNETDNL